MQGDSRVHVAISSSNVLNEFCFVVRCCLFKAKFNLFIFIKSKSVVFLEC